MKKSLSHFLDSYCFTTKTFFSWFFGIIILTSIFFYHPHSDAELNNMPYNPHYNIAYSTSKSPNDSNYMDFIFDNKTSIYGSSYSEWTAEWWKWAYSIPMDIHPAYDDYGIDCNINQEYPVWFFPGTFNHSVTRYCLVPNDVGILFPILNSECSYLEYPYIISESELSDCAKIIQDHVIGLNTTLDGFHIPANDQFRIQSPSFNFTLHENNILNITGKDLVTSAVSDGNWVFLKPLKPGKHTITFKGSIAENLDQSPNPLFNNTKDFALPIGWNYSTTYEIIVFDSKLVPESKKDNVTNNSSNIYTPESSLQLTLDKQIKSTLLNIFSDSVNYYNPVDNKTIQDFIQKARGWQIILNSQDGSRSLTKQFSFDNFADSIRFTYLVGKVSQILNHHPMILIDWKDVELVLHTWSLDNTISNFDLGSAVLYDQLYSSCCKVTNSSNLGNNNSNSSNDD